MSIFQYGLTPSRWRHSLLNQGDENLTSLFRFCLSKAIFMFLTRVTGRALKLMIAIFIILCVLNLNGSWITYIWISTTVSHEADMSQRSFVRASYTQACPLFLKSALFFCRSFSVKVAALSKMFLDVCSIWRWRATVYQWRRGGNGQIHAAEENWPKRTRRRDELNRCGLFKKYSGILERSVLLWWQRNYVHLMAPRPKVSGRTGNFCLFLSLHFACTHVVISVWDFD